MNRHKRVSVSSNCSASVPAGRWRAISTAHASNRSVNPLPGLAHGGGHRPHPVLGARDAGHGGVDERLVLEEVQVPPHTLPPVMHRAGVFPAACLGTMEAGAGLEADHDVQLLPAAVGVTEVHGPHLPR